MPEDYITDTPYTWGFYSDFSPLNLSYIAMMGGVAPLELGRPFRMLELGCGNGVSVNTYAACYPDAEFHGVDLNPEHVRNAERLAREGGLGNVTFHETSFAALKDLDLGQFDVVAAHGVYSWVGPEVRAEIRDILNSNLRPGGYFYVSYNAMPGWAPVMPLRQIMLAYTESMQLSSIERVKHGLKYLCYLRDNRSGYFSNNTAAERMLDTMLEHDPRYIAHEYFHRYWNAFYFDEVARDMQACDLGYAGSIPSMMNIRDLSIPQAFRDVFNTAPSRNVYETHKSFVLNEMFRRDLFVKAPAAALPSDQVAAWRDVLFGPLTARESMTLERQFPVGNVTYSGPIYPVLTGLLSDQVRSYGELCELPELADFQPSEILNSLHFLCAGGQFGLMLDRLQPTQQSANGNGWRLSADYNRALLTSRILQDSRLNLASRVIGNGVGVDLLSGLAALALDQAADAEAETWAWVFLKQHDQTLRVDGTAVEGKEAQVDLLKERFARFRSQSLERMAQYGIMEPR